METREGLCYKSKHFIRKKRLVIRTLCGIVFLLCYYTGCLWVDNDRSLLAMLNRSMQVQI